MRTGDERPEQMDDVSLQPVLASVVHQALQNARRDDAAAADQDGARPRPQLVVDVFVIFVRAHDVVEVLLLDAELLQIRQVPQARIADRAVDILRPERDARGR